jgi:hypothetical protein
VWRFSLDFYQRDAHGRELCTATRTVAVSTLAREPKLSIESAGLALATLAVLLFAPAAAGGAAWVVVALALVQALLFAWGLNRSTPRSEHFPPTETERILRSEFPAARIFGGEGVFPGNTHLECGARSLGGSDMLGVAAFDDFRAHVLLPGKDPVLDWNAEGVDLSSSAFRVLGVSVLALRAPRDISAWELVAGPELGAPRRAEVFLYKKLDALPRVLCVARSADRARVTSDPASFDPAHEAILEPSATWRPEKPFSQATIVSATWGEELVRVRVHMDGDGLLVFTEQSFPGWRARVDGAECTLMTVDAIYRGVALSSGEHAVELSYEPASLRLGAWISCAALVTTLLMTWATGRRARSSSVRVPR